MKWQCQDSQLAKTKRSCQESAWPDAAADVPCVQSRATVCWCARWGRRGEQPALAKTLARRCQPDTCSGTPHGLCCHLIFPHRSAGGPPFPSFHATPSFAKSGVGARSRPSSPSVAKSFQVASLNSVLAAGHRSRMPVSANSV